MARRTVENINGFVAARPPVKKSAVVPPQPCRSKSTWVTASGKKPVQGPAVKAADSAPPLTKKKDQQKPLQQSPVVKVSKPQRNVTGKNNLASVQIKQEDVKIKQNELKPVRKVEKVIETINNSTIDYSSDVSENKEYEDDFEEYESDFESETSIESLPHLLPSLPITVVQSTSGTTNVKCTQPLRVVEKLESFLDERFEVNSLEWTVEMGLKNFLTAGKRKRQQEAKEKIQTRGNVLMEMIKLDTVSYTLLDLPAIPYEQYIKMYGRLNAIQIQTQTHDDNAEKEVQTNDIDFIEKWTQHPIILTNELDCSSLEYLNAKLGVGDTGSNVDHQRLTRITTVDPDRVCMIGRTILSMLEQQAMDRAERKLIANKFDLAFSNGYLSPAVSNVKFLAKCPITSIKFAQITSLTESLVTIHQVMDSCHQYVLCIWSVSIMECPEYVLKCPNSVTSFCAIFKSTSGFVTTSHADGSICVWDLRESRLHHQQIDGSPCVLRSPSFNTALSADQCHRLKIVGLSTVTYSNVGATNDELPDEFCSLDEDFVLTVWTVVDSWADATEISEPKSAGTAPWSSVRLVKMQTVETNKNVPRHVSDGVVATCMCLNNNQDAFIGTSSGLIFRYNLGEHRVWPSYYTHDDKGEHFSINCLDICPFDSNYFMAACSSGELLIYCVNRREVIRRFIASPGPQRAMAPIIKAQWCIGFPGIVFGLDLLSSVHLWDFCDDVITPTMSIPFPDKTVKSMSLSSSGKQQNTYMGLAFADGAVEMHQIKLDKRITAVDEGIDDRYDLLARVLASLS